MTAPNIPDIAPASQWVFDWDDTAGGWRGTAGGWQTGAYMNPGAARKAVENGAVYASGTAVVQSEASETSAANGVSEGLVSCQQSLNPLPAPMPDMAPSASARAERQRGRDANPIPKVRQRGRVWAITLTDGKQTTTLDSFWSRLSRCNKRVKAWSTALPRINRRKRRAYKERGIGPRMVMLTLTYEDGDTWEPNHIRSFMLELRKLLKDKLWAYAWVLEMQERGAPHYHVMAYVAPGTDIPNPDEAGLWPHGCTRRETAKKGAYYLMKYTGKGYQKEGLPPGARMFAVWIGKKQATPDELFGFRLSSAPPYLQEAIKAYYEEGHVNAEVRWGRRVGGGWVIKDLGEVLQSAWYLVGIEPIVPKLNTGRDEGDNPTG